MTTFAHVEARKRLAGKGVAHHNLSMPSGVEKGGASIDVAAAVVVDPGTGPDPLGVLADPVAVVTRRLAFEHVNRAWKSTFGTDRSFVDIAGEVVAAAIEGGLEGATDFRLPTCDIGHCFQATVIPADDRFVVHVRDVTAQLMAEDAARSQTDWYRRALLAVGEGTWEYDVAEEVCWLSPALREKLGCPASQELEVSELVEMIHPEDRAVHADALQSALEGEAPLHVEIRMLTVNGARWSQISGAVLRDNQGKPLRVAGMVVDIHERKMIEEQLREINRALESKVADRTRELAQTNEELQSFCYSVSHDLRGPLRSINGFGKALEEDYAHLFNDQGRDYLTRIRKAAIRLSGLIDGLLNLARITQAGMKREPLDIGEIARELLDDLCRTMPDRNGEYVIQPDLKTYGDLNLVRLALANLVENAWKFSSRSERTLIEVGQEGEAFYVRDHGAGFNMEYAAKLFAPFERLHTEAEFPGTGLGLAVVQRVVQRHHGTVWAEGEPNKGATVYFTLPSRKRDRKAAQTP